MTLQNTSDDETLPPEAKSQDASTEEQAGEGDRPLTMAEFEILWSEREQRLTSRLQSMTDKAESRIQRKYGELSAGNARAVQVAKQTGMTPEQLAAYEKALHEDAMKQALGGGTPPDEGDPDPDAIDPQAVTEQGRQLWVELGLTGEDPERVFINNKGTPAEYLNSIRYAGEMKKRRLQAAPPAPPRPGQVPGLVRGGKAPPKNPIADINSADELYEMGWGEMRKRASG